MAANESQSPPPPRRRGRRPRGLVVWLALQLLAGSAQSAPPPAASPAADQVEGWRWRRAEVPSRGAPISALAIDAARGRLALGDELGVLVRPLSDEAPGPGASAPPWRRWSAVGPVNDLHFDAAGVLWIGSERGLWRLSPDASGVRLEDRSPAPGEVGRRVRRVRGTGGLLVAASDAGAFVRADGGRWRRIVHGLPVGPVTAVALRQPPTTSWREPHGSVEIWLLSGGELWRVVARSAAGGPVLTPARRERIPGRPAGVSPVDLVAGVPGGEVAVLYPRALARLLPAQIEERRWEVWYPVLPPGASAQRLSGAAGLVWLATDRGLLVAGSLPGPWQRTASPVGSAAAGPVVGAGGVVYAVSEPGLAEGRREPAAGRRAPGPGIGSVARDPELRLVHRRALAWAGLEPEYFRGLRRSLGRRGWLPLLSLRAGAAYDRDTSDDRDQSFSYGELHDLRDRGSARSRDFDATLTLVWDLGDIAYPPDAPDLSREQRQVVTLRDNVLDEVNQLYFDRRRALIALSAYADRSDPEAVALELRGRELASGLDAWTGGWFSSQIVTAPADPDDS